MFVERYHVVIAQALEESFLFVSLALADGQFFEVHTHGAAKPARVIPVGMGHPFGHTRTDRNDANAHAPPANVRRALARRSCGAWPGFCAAAAARALRFPKPAGRRLPRVSRVRRTRALAVT